MLQEKMIENIREKCHQDIRVEENRRVRSTFYITPVLKYIQSIRSRSRSPFSPRFSPLHPAN